LIEYFIAKKHIKERKRQSILAVLGITLGMTVLLVSLAISNGLNQNMIHNILSMTAHIEVSNSEMAISNYDELKIKLEKIEGVKGAMPKYTTQGILKYSGDFGTYVSGVVINGIQENTAKQILGLDKKIKEGKLDLNKLTNVIIGKELYNQIGAKIGDKVKIVSPESKELYLTIGGVYESGYYEFDSTLLLIPLKTVQILSEAGNIVTGIDVKVDNVYKAEEVAERIKKIDSQLSTRTWGELNKNLLYALSLEKTVMILLLSLIIIIAGFVVGVILNTLVREKTKDIGIIRSMGLSKIRVMKTFFLEGVILGVLGIISGNIFSIIIIKLIKMYSEKLPLNAYYLTKLPVVITFKDFALISIATLMIIIISSIFPANSAAKLTPVEALKYE